MATSAVPGPKAGPRVVNRWLQMIAGIVAMMAIANLQYAWTLFTKPLTTNFSVTLAAVQVAFAAFIFAETWLVPFEGYLVDRLGPRLLIAIGGVLVGAGWIGSGYAASMTGVIVWYAIGGIGAGADLWRLRRQRAQVVPRSSRPVCRGCLRRVWHRNGGHGGPHRQHDQELRIPADVHHLGVHPGRDRRRWPRCSSCNRPTAGCRWAGSRARWQSPPWT